MCLLPTLFISLAIQESPPYSRQRRYKAKKAKAKRKHHCLFFFPFGRCCYSCKQKSRHPIILVGERKRQDPRQPASPLPSPPKKKKQNLARISSIKSMDCCESTPLPVGTYSLTHSPMFGIPETLPYSETLFFLSLSLSVFLPCPATPNSKLCLSRPSQGLRFLSVLSCFVLSARAHDDVFHSLSLSRYRHQSITKPTVS